MLSGPKASKIPPFLPPLLLVVVAVFYYGSYYRSGFNLADDGSVALLCQRLLEGEKPFTELLLGYNFLWFYPIVGLFKIFGVNFLVLRIWFFFLATLTALFGYATVKRCTGKPVFAFLVALLLLAIPGTTNKTYIPLIIAANGFLLVSAVLSWPEQKKYFFTVCMGAFVLGLSYLIRIDLGIFFTVLWGGVGVLVVFCKGEAKRFLHVPLLSWLILISGVLLLHLPVLADARQRGYEKEFLNQYGIHYKLIIGEAARKLGIAGKKKSPPPKTAPSKPEIAPVKNNESSAEAGQTLQRRPLEDIWAAKKSKDRWLAVLIYSPLLAVALLLGFAGWHWFSKRDREGFRQSLVLVILTGSALTAFPQFFSFRPDVAHLSEFMPGLLIALAAGCAVIISWAFQAVRKHWVFGILSLSFFLFLGTTYVCYTVDRPVAGSISARFGRDQFFEAENGVRVYLNEEEFGEFTAIRDLVLQNSKPSDYVVCYPYSPGINFMTDRHTYEGRLYVDDVFRSPAFNKETIKKIERYRPAVIVINDWAINKTESSRFSFWAKEVYDYVNSHYRLAGKFGKEQIYLRRENEAVAPL